MSAKIFAFGLGCLFAVAAYPASGLANECGLPPISGSRDLHEFLSLRAVEVVKRAASPDGDLVLVVSPTAPFSLGAGDVGRPLGTGVNGARELARTMSADTFRFLGWDYMDQPATACSEHKVEVEFIDSQRRRVARVQFTFHSGRVVKAAGWQRSFETGLLSDGPANR